MKNRVVTSLFSRSLFALLAVALSNLMLAPRARAQPSGYALDFSPASNNYVSVNLPAPPASNYTLTAWVKLRTGGTASGTRMAVLSGTSCPGSIEFLIHAWTDTPTDPQSLELGRCGAFNGGGTSSFVPLNTWTHVAATVSSNKLVNYYINGSPAGSWDGTGFDLSFTGTVRLGANGFRGYDGLVDNFQLWTRELSAAEIQTNVTQQLTGSESGLYSWYPFDEGSGNTTTNKAVAAGGSTGTLVNNPQWVAQPAFTNVPIAGLQQVFESSVAWGDYDNDGRFDFLLTGHDGTQSISQLWRNTGSGFTNVTATAFPPDSLAAVRFALAYLGYHCSPAWGDFDNDGRLDLLIAGEDTNNTPVVQLWRNTGSGFTNLTATAALGLPQVDLGALAWGDYDNDGRLDFLIAGAGTNNVNYFQLWRNTGSGFTNVTATAAPSLPGVYYSSVAWGDYDNDGRLDFLLTGKIGNGNGVSQLWRNNGNGTFSDVTATAAPGLPGVYSGSVAWGDYDNDGRLDFLLTGLNGSGVSQLWRNTGNGFINVPLPSLPGVNNSSMAWADCDNDGRLDFLLTGASGANYFSQLWHNNAPFSNAPPSAPTGLALTAITNGALLSWNSATDDHTPATGLTYNVRAGSTPGGIDLFAGHVNAANGFRRVPALGNAMLRHSLLLTGLTNGQTVYWSVQAVDTGFAGGPFAAETSVVTIPTLAITPSDTTNALVSWTPPTWGWFLQESPSLSPAAWSNSASGELNPVSVSATNAAKFYRLNRP